MSTTKKILGQHVKEVDGLVITPKDIKEKYPLSTTGANVFTQTILAIQDVLDRKDPRKIALVGPCSIHDYDANLDYAEQLKKIADEVSDELIVVMRYCIGKPRSGPEWTGYIDDPNLDGSNDGNRGYELSRKLATTILGEIGLPLGMEVMDTTAHQHLDDVLCYAWIGARDSITNNARNLGSILTPPVGVKNMVLGNGYDQAARNVHYVTKPHRLKAPDENGNWRYFDSTGNPYAHMILRGMNGTSNYEPGNVRLAHDALVKLGLVPNIIVDCNHDNSGKDHTKQAVVLNTVLDQMIANESHGGKNIVGFLVESHLKSGNVSIADYLTNPSRHYGVSITDKCLGIEDTKALLYHVHDELKKR